MTYNLRADSRVFLFFSWQKMIRGTLYSNTQSANVFDIIVIDNLIK